MVMRKEVLAELASSERPIGHLGHLAVTDICADSVPPNWTSVCSGVDCNVARSMPFAFCFS